MNDKKSCESNKTFDCYWDDFHPDGKAGHRCRFQ
jgi:hypothetical protein